MPCQFNPQEPLSLCFLPLFIGRVISFFPFIGGFGAVFLIITSGIQFLLSGGDPIKVAKAKKTLTFAIIGLVIIILAYFLIQVLGKSLGFDLKPFKR